MISCITMYYFSGETDEHSTVLDVKEDTEEIKKIFAPGSFEKGTYMFQIVYGDTVIFTGYTEMN